MIKVMQIFGIRKATPTLEAGLTVTAGGGVVQRVESFGERTGHRLLESRPVWSRGYILAMGAVAECQSSEISIPDEISIAGFDDLDTSSQIKPALTTRRLSSAEMGEKAAEYRVAQIRQEPMPPPVKMGTRLMVRETRAKPRIRGQRTGHLIRVFSPPEAVDFIVGSLEGLPIPVAARIKCSAIRPVDESVGRFYSDWLHQVRFFRALRRNLWIFSSVIQSLKAVISRPRVSFKRILAGFPALDWGRTTGPISSGVLPSASRSITWRRLFKSEE